MNILRKILRLTKRKTRPLRYLEKLQIQPNNLPLNCYHVDNGGKPLCNHQGQFINLCSREDFENLTKGTKCGTCLMILGHRENYHKTAWLSDQQKELLIDIYRKTGDGSEGQWCSVDKLLAERNESRQASYKGSLKNLKNGGVIEVKADEQSRELARVIIDCVHSHWYEGVKTYSVC